MITLAVCTAIGAASGLLVPLLIRALPEPPVAEEPETLDQTEQPTEPPKPRKPRRPIPDFSLWGMHSIERDKEPYALMSRASGLVPGVVVAGGALGALLGWRLGATGALAIWLPLVPVLIAITVIDWRSRLIPTRLVLPATAYAIAAGGVIALVEGERTDFVRGLIALALIRSFFWVLWFLRSAGMGFGDVRLAALLGFALGFVGPAEAFLGTYVGFIVFAVPGVLLAVARGNRQLLRVGFPFGPFMIIGALLGVGFGHDVGSALLG